MFFQEFLSIAFPHIKVQDKNKFTNLWTLASSKEI